VAANQAGSRKAGNKAITSGPVTIVMKNPIGYTGKVYRIAEISINLLRGLRVGTVAGLLRGDHGTAEESAILARRLGLSKRTVDKLMGPEGRDGFRGHIHRPLLAPAITFILQTEIPRAVERALARRSKQIGKAE
jgi:hypothetical protein